MDLFFIYDITNTAYHPRHSKEAKLKGASLALVGPVPLLVFLVTYLEVIGLRPF